MSPDRFEYLLSLIGPPIIKKNCPRGKSIYPSQQLITTLEETCFAICKVLKKIFQRASNDIQEWQNIIKKFNQNWNFPKFIGAIDGKHVRIETPAKSGSSFYNYKGFYSMILLAICGAKYCFTVVDIGGYRRDNDTSILNASNYQNLPI
ncbi:uncharacterized protein LOC124815219 [Hydra vulgaris]|uniref:uncharacterized protein LOC124815219 n=1 Tax=Hydra vulgaris TaxID=6087 RepID=UPI001F5F91D5|nr:uncharacterized protein LOC124815219 [Hydra vulgaris]